LHNGKNGNNYLFKINLKSKKENHIRFKEFSKIRIILNDYFKTICEILINNSSANHLQKVDMKFKDYVKKN
jgi:hypothetical protein